MYVSLRLACAVLTWMIFVSVSGQVYGDEIPLGSDGGVYTVAVVVNGSVKIPFIVDSGAAAVVIPEDVFRTLVRGGTISPSDVLGPVMITLADGSTQRRMRFRLREVQIGVHRAENVIATVSPQNADPLLGQSFLSRFGSVSFDYRRHVLVLPDPGSALAGQPATITSLPPGASDAGQPEVVTEGYGAFALDENSGRYGMVWNQVNEASAEYYAMKGCGLSILSCKVVFRVAPHQCGAIATADTGKVWGGSIRPTKSAAELAALQNCQKRTAAQCRLRGSECNR